MTLTVIWICFMPLQWRHNGRDGVSNHQPHDCLLNRLFRRRSKKILKLRVTGLCAGNSPVAGEFPAQMASNAENVSIWWHHHANNTNFRHSSIVQSFLASPQNPICRYWTFTWRVNTRHWLMSYSDLAVLFTKFSIIPYLWSNMCGYFIVLYNDYRHMAVAQYLWNDP